MEISIEYLKYTLHIDLMYVCMCVCMCAFLYVCMYVCVKYVCMYVRKVHLSVHGIVEAKVEQLSTSEAREPVGLEIFIILDGFVGIVPGHRRVHFLAIFHTLIRI